MEVGWRVKDLAVLVTTLIECTLVGGTIFGWPSLVYIFQDEGFYNYLCPDVLLETTTRHDGIPSNVVISQPTWTLEQRANHENITLELTDDDWTCLLQKQRLSLGYTIGMTCFGLSSFPFGLLFDRYGLRLTRTINVVAGLTGYILLVCASPTGYPWLIFPGAALVGISCSCLILTTTHIARLARDRVFGVTSLYVGFLSMGSAFQGVKLGYDHGVPRTYTILALGSVWFLVLFSTWVLLPKYKVIPVELDTPASQSDTGKSRMTGKGNGKHLEKDTTRHKPNCKQEVQSLRACVLSPLYICFLLWFVSLHVRVHMFVNVFTAWVTEVVHGDITRVSFYTDVLAYALMAGVVVSPVAGVIVDAARSYLKGADCGSEDDKTIAALPSIVLSSAMVIGFSVAALFHNDAAIYSGIIFIVLSKFPLDHYGSLFGLMHLTGGVGSTTMYAYYAWAANNTRGFFTVHIFLLVTVLLSNSLAVMILYRFWRRRTTSDIISNTRL